MSGSGQIAVVLGAMALFGMVSPLPSHGQAAADKTGVVWDSGQRQVEFREGGIIRGPATARKLAVVFTGHEFVEGGEVILEELGKHKGKGSFFLTGAFLTNANFQPLIQRIVKDGNYLGPHSDGHLLYCPWDDPKKTLVSRAEFEADMLCNLEKIKRLGVPPAQIRYFLPPYEHYNQQIADWARALGMTLINYTPGTRSNADYTGEADSNFVSSKAIFQSIVARERTDANGLNGFILLLHIGSGPGRADKFTARFGELLDYLAGKGYQLVRIDELLGPK
jgi:endoglucanase